MRDVAATIAALERKARDSAVAAPERDALLSKASELRERYQVPQTQAAAPPMPPPPPRPPAPPSANGNPWPDDFFTNVHITQTWGNATSTTVGNVSSSATYTFMFTSS